jgi:hypothetical protein
VKFTLHKLFALSLALVVFNVFADSNSLLNQAGSEIDLNPKIQAQKTLSLDNPFVIQLYATWKALGPIEMTSNQWIELVLNNEYEKALSSISIIKDSKMQKIVEATELYLLYKTSNFQTFTNRFIEISAKSPFLQSELGIALDQIAGPKFTSIILENGLFLSSDQHIKLKQIENYTSKVNFSLQAFNALRTGEHAVNWIGKLDESDPLKLPLANTALLFYAKDGKLGASGKIIKSVIEPILAKSNNEEEISLYFMTLARLLYQANALSESEKYYSLIPESSKYFLKARTEKLWAHIKARDYSKTKGELGTLEMKIFNNQFYPEAYLVSSMANVMLCQFIESRAAINRFIDANKYWAKEIDKNLGNVNASPIENSFFLKNLSIAEKSLKSEIDRLEKNNVSSNYVLSLKDKLAKIDVARKVEVQTQWSNRKTLLETALYKMKFVRVELLSRMRQYELNQPIANGDEVKVQMAANAKKDQLKFKNDGVLFGDELFHMSAKIKNKCLMPPENKSAVK